LTAPPSPSRTCPKKSHWTTVASWFSNIPNPARQSRKNTAKKTSCLSGPENMLGANENCRDSPDPASHRGKAGIFLPKHRKDQFKISNKLSEVFLLLPRGLHTHPVAGWGREATSRSNF
jgi:hypothetical protein